MAWDDDKKAKAVELYDEAGPTPETSAEIVAEIAEELDESANGVRMILVKAGVYVKKDASAAATKGAKGASTRVSKAASQEALTAAITAFGKEADEEIISKLTGKAAVYFTSILSDGEETED